MFIFLSVILLSLVVGLYPRTTITIVDVILFTLGLTWFICVVITKKKSIEAPPLFFPIAAWFGIGLISTLTNMVFGNIDSVGSIFFILRDAWFFFLYFCLFYLFQHLRNREAIQWILKLWIAIGVVHVAWIVFQTISGMELTYYYGHYNTYIRPAGGFLLLIFAFLLNVFLYQYCVTGMSLLKKGGLLLIIILPVLGIWNSGSRAALIGLILIVFLSFFLYSWQNQLLRRYLLTVSLLLLLAGAILPWHLSYYNPPKDQKVESLHRTFEIQNVTGEFDLNNPGSRANIWKLQIIELLKKPSSLIIGHGKAAKTGGVGSHNFYLEVIDDTGFIGLSFFFLLIFSVVKITWQGFSNSKDSLVKGLCAGLLMVTLAMLIISFSEGAFRAFKLAELYWYFVAVTIATLTISQHKEDDAPQV